MSLDFLFGRGFLTVEGHRAGGGLTLERLRMEIPDLRFPFDIGAGRDRFRSIRCHVQEIRCTFGESALLRALAPAFAQVEGFEDIRLHLESDSLFLQARTTLLSKPATFAVRLALAPPARERPQELIFVPVEHLALSEISLPLPLLVSELMGRVIRSAPWQALLPDRALTLRGETLVVPLLPLIVAEIFLPLGWKLPALERLPSPEVEIRPGALRIAARLPGLSEASTDAPAPLREATSGELGARALSWLAAARSIGGADAALFGGAPEQARDVLHARYQEGARHDLIVARLSDLMLLSGHRGDLEEALRIAEARRRSSPEDVIAMQVQARADLRRGDLAAYRDGIRMLRESFRGRGRIREQILVLVEGARALRGRADEDALAFVEDALKLDPRDSQALELRAGLARERAEFEVLEDVLRRIASVAEERARKVRALIDLSELALRRRADHGEARMYLERALDLAPQMPALHEELARAWEAVGRPAEAVRAWEAAAERWREGDPQRAAQAGLAGARIWADTLEDVEAALVLVRRVLEWCPESVPLMLAGLRLCLRAGHLDEGARLLQRVEAALGADAQASAADRETELEVLRLSARLDDERGRPELAALTRRRILRLHPEDASEFRAVASWLQQAGVPEDLVNLHEERLELLPPTATEARVQARLALARLYRDVLEQPGQAWRHFAELLSEAPGHALALEEAEALCARRGTDLEFAELLRALRERLPEGESADALDFACARAGLRGGDRAGALDLLRRLSRRHGTALQAHRLLAQYAPPEEVVLHLREIAERTPDPDEAYRLLVELGDRALAAPEGAAEATRHYRAALAIRHESEIEARMRSAAKRAGLEPEVPGAPAAPRTPDRTPRAPQAPHRGADTADTGARIDDVAMTPPIPPAQRAGTGSGEADPGWGVRGAPPLRPDAAMSEAPGATATARESAEVRAEARGAESAETDSFGTASWSRTSAVAAKVEGRESLEAALEAARQAGELEKEAELLEELAAGERAGDRRAGFHSELGRLLYFDLEDPARARAHLEETLRLDPEGEGRSFEVLQALEGVYEELEDHDALLGVHRRRLEGAKDEMRVALRLLMAQLLLEKLGRPEDALSLVEDALREARDHVPSLRLKGEILESVGRFEEAAGALERLLNQRDLDPFEAQEVQRTLARIEWRELGRLEAALGRYEVLQREVPGDPESLSALKQIHVQRQDWEACARVLLHELGLLMGNPSGLETPDAVLAVEKSAVPKALRSTFARIVAELARVLVPTGKREQSLGLLERASLMAPSDVTVLEAQAELGASLGAPHLRGQALEALAEMLLSADERAATLSQAVEAFREAGQTEHALQLERQLDALRDAFRELGPESGTPEETATSDFAAVEEAASPPRSAEEIDGERARSEEAERHSAHLSAARTLPPELVDELDALASAGQLERALERIDGALPLAREPRIRRALLLRKGRWIIDTSGASRDASLVLKGALILDENAVDTRFELMRAYIRYTDTRLALEQFREFAARVDPGWLEERQAQVLGELKRLSRLPDAPGLERLQEELLASSSPK